MTATSTSTKASLLLLSLFLTISVVSATHNSGSIVGDSGFGAPDYDDHWEIASKLAAPFVFVTLLFQISLNTTFAYTLADGDKSQYRRITTIMALAITGMLVPSPFWDYIIFASQSIGLIAVTTLVFVFGLIFYWIASSERRAKRRRRL